MTETDKYLHYRKLQFLVNELDILLGMKLWKEHHPEIIRIKEILLDEISKPKSVISKSIMLLLKKVLEPIFLRYGRSKMKSPYEIEDENEREIQHVKNVGERITICMDIIYRDILS